MCCGLTLAIVRREQGLCNLPPGKEFPTSTLILNPFYSLHWLLSLGTSPLSLSGLQSPCSCGGLGGFHPAASPGWIPEHGMEGLGAVGHKTGSASGWRNLSDTCYQPARFAAGAEWRRNPGTNMPVPQSCFPALTPALPAHPSFCPWENKRLNIRPGGEGFQQALAVCLKGTIRGTGTRAGEMPSCSPQHSPQLGKLTCQGQCPTGLGSPGASLVAGADESC